MEDLQPPNAQDDAAVYDALVSRGRRFELDDRSHKLTFTGRRLGRASSRGADKRRWTEVDIYRTDEGTYVVSSVGMSLERGEQPYRWVTVCVQAAGVVQTLYQYDDDGIRYLTHVARRALERAAKEDDGIKRALAVEEVA